MKDKKESRSKAFFITAVILTILVYSIFYFVRIKAEWYIEPIIVILLSLFHTFYPVTFTRALSLFLVIPLGALTIVAAIVYWVIIFFIMVSMFFVQVAFTVAIFVVPGFIFVYGGNKILKGLGATLGSIIFITLIITYARNILKVAKEIVCNTWVEGWKWFKELAEVLNPYILVEYIWEGAKTIGEYFGGDINNFFNYLIEFIVEWFFDR